MRRSNRNSQWIVVVLFALMALVTVTQAPLADASTPPSVRVSIAWFVVPVGAQLAIECVRDSSTDPSTDPIYVKRWTLTDSERVMLSQEVYQNAPEIGEWLGVVSLRDADGEPLPPADYSLEIATTVGTFAVGIRAIDATPSGRFSLSATVNGISLEVYRLVTEEDAGRTLDLRIGDRLMVLLEGNPTTGYQWTSALPSESPILSSLAEPEYRPGTTQPGVVGAGGEYLFRYEAVSAGTQALPFVYKRPWETTESDREFSFDAFVHP